MGASRRKDIKEFISESRTISIEEKEDDRIEGIHREIFIMMITEEK